LCLFKLKVVGKLRNIIAQTTVEDEWVYGKFIDGLTKPEVQSIHSETFCLVLLYYGFVWCCATCWGDLKYVLVMLKRSPPHLFLYLLLLLTKKQKGKEKKRKQARALPVSTLGSLTFIIIIIPFFVTYYYYYYFILCVHPTFYHLA